MKTPVLLLASFVSALACAQDKMTVPNVFTLLDCGFNETEVLRVLQKDGVVVAEADRGLLADPRLPKAVAAWLVAEAERVRPKPLTLEDVIDHWRSGKDAVAIRERVAATGTRLELSVDDILRLSRLGFPDDLLKWLRADPAAERVANGLTGDRRTAKLSTGDVLRLSVDGVDAAEILSRISASESVFQLEAGDIIELHRAGVDRAVLKEMYRRRLAEAITTSTPAAESRPATETPAALAAPGTELTLHRDEAGTFSLLVPDAFLASKEFRGNKALLQLVDRAVENERDLPDIEVSVLRVIPKDKDHDSFVPENLTPVATQFIEGLRRRFESDGIKVIAGQPKSMWLSDRPGVIVQTSATTPEGVGYLGTTRILMSEDGMYVVSWSLRAEFGAKWRPLLEECAKSFSITASRRPEPEAESITLDPRDALHRLFSTWKNTLYRYDWLGWQAIHTKLDDTPETRRAFVEAADELVLTKKRVEATRHDAVEGWIEYAVHDEQGRSVRRLDLVKAKQGWILQ